MEKLESGEQGSGEQVNGKQGRWHRGVGVENGELGVADQGWRPGIEEQRRGSAEG